LGWSLVDECLLGGVLIEHGEDSFVSVGE